ncbi:MAG: type II toxin-antitoxin system Phd/YefM family antitoxin [Ferruginibacter sp.]
MTATYSNFKLKLKSYLEDISKSNIPLLITRKKGESAVILSQSECDSIMETFYLMKSPTNAKRLLSALDE